MFAGYLSCTLLGKQSMAGKQRLAGSQLVCIERRKSVDQSRVSSAARASGGRLSRERAQDLALQRWGVPGLALCGTVCSATTLQLLGQWERLYAMLDTDAAGQAATARLAEALGPRLIPVQLPSSVKDPADLAPLVEGSAALRDAIRKAVDRHICSGYTRP
jgi:hypothetical protein